MTQASHITYHREGTRAWTQGLAIWTQQELRAGVTTPDLARETEDLLRYFVTYLHEQDTRLRAQETSAYGYWLVQFRSSADGFLDLWEVDPTTLEYVPGVTHAITFWRAQQRLCREAGAAFDPPFMARLGVISDGVYEGLLVEGMRYPSPEHMSGWWFVADQYDGNIDSMRPVHLHHITAARPELAQYLALPTG